MARSAQHEVSVALFIRLLEDIPPEYSGPRFFYGFIKLYVGCWHFNYI